MQEFLQQLVNGITWGSVYALIALGYTMVYGILRLINFAHGDVFMLGAFFAFYAANKLNVTAAPSPLKAILVLVVAMAGAGIVGFLIERFAYRPVRNSSRLTALITAIGVSLLLENGGLLVFGTEPKRLPPIVRVQNIDLGGGVTVTNVQLIIILVALVLMAVLRWIVLSTRTGKAMRAVSYNRDAATLMGIPTDRIISFTFVLGATLAAAAGVLVGLLNPKIDPLMGIMPGLKAFVAAVVGGIGNIPGAVLGGLIMGLAEVLVVGYVSSTYRDAIAFVLLIAILLFRPSGLLGKHQAEKV
jgi:branched-chain amino acid transport system permease protein